MKTLNNFINESVRVGKSNKQLIDLSKFPLIVKNLRKDCENYFGFIAELTEDLTIDSVDNRSVWGEYNSPVNKCFDREDPVEIEFFKGDKVILICDTWDEDDYDFDNESNEQGIKNLYICKYKDIWYYLDSNDAPDFLEYVKIIKENNPKEWPYNIKGLKK